MNRQWCILDAIVRYEGLRIVVAVSAVMQLEVGWRNWLCMTILRSSNTLMLYMTDLA